MIWEDLVGIICVAVLVAYIVAVFKTQQSPKLKPSFFKRDVKVGDGVYSYKIVTRVIPKYNKLPVAGTLDALRIEDNYKKTKSIRKTAKDLNYSYYAVRETLLNAGILKVK